MARKFRALRKAVSGAQGQTKTKGRYKPMGMGHGLLAKEISLPPSKFRNLSSKNKKRGGGKYT